MSTVESMSNEQRPTNRLIHEKSPYLLQHAHNPVDWYPWCDEAFENARRTDRMVLLSIGYATCHWCHVMERESFENEETARLLNERYVAIKVDREERPDVDQIYMQALHATGQHGGWPLNMFLTPDRLPITGGTYFPPIPAYGRPSFAQILQTLADAWQNERDKLLQSANTLHDFLQRQEQTSGQNDSAVLPELENVHNALQQYKSMFDEFRGGFVANGPNKFPPSMGLLFLMEYHRRFPESDALNMVETTLDHMLRGGIYDQIGGGLARYATDHDWLVPHFEKMLYDNALFAWALVDCYRITNNERYKTAAYDI
ncbi:MAG: thioredoxin domain-containing protein, partial [Leptospiraceae bacterium]|nr:thioredoxin domain-containing protein [Leptospiraceae bacterium]